MFGILQWHTRIFKRFGREISSKRVIRKTNSQPVLLKDDYKLSFTPIAHSKHLDENYLNVEYLFHGKSVRTSNSLQIILGKQSGSTKYPCFLWGWDSRARDQHYRKSL